MYLKFIKNNMNGFYNYSDSSTIMNCYYDLLRHIRSYTRNIDDLMGISNDLYDKSREMIIYKFILEFYMSFMNIY